MLSGNKHLSEWPHFSDLRTGLVNISKCTISACVKKWRCGNVDANGHDHPAQHCGLFISQLSTLKALSKIAADDILPSFFFSKKKKKKNSEIYTVCYLVFYWFWLTPLFATTDMSNLKDGRVFVRKLGVKRISSIFAWEAPFTTW